MCVSRDFIDSYSPEAPNNVAPHRPFGRAAAGTIVRRGLWPANVSFRFPRPRQLFQAVEIPRLARSRFGPERAASITSSACRRGLFLNLVFTRVVNHWVTVLGATVSSGANQGRASLGSRLKPIPNVKHEPTRV